MIKIIKATYRHDYVVKVEFSDGTHGELDLAPLLARETAMTRPLRTPTEFRRFFLELGALCWPNGFELSPRSIHQKLEQTDQLRRLEVA